MAQTKADRKAAAKKAAATRQRNQLRETSHTRGKKAAASRQQNLALRSLGDAKRTAGSVVGNVTGATKSVGGAAKQAGKSVATRVGIGGR